MLQTLLYDETNSQLWEPAREANGGVLSGVPAGRRTTDAVSEGQLLIHSPGGHRNVNPTEHP